MFKHTLLVAMLALATQAHAADAAFDPASRNVDVGDTFTMTVRGSGFATNLDGGGLNLSFDPAVLHVADVLIDGTAWDFLPGKGTIDNAAGTVTGTTFNQFAHPKLGSFEILQYQFDAVGAGSSLLQLTQFGDNPFASGGEVVPMTFSDGTVTVAAVSAIPEPSTALMLGAGLLLGIALRRRR